MGSEGELAAQAETPKWRRVPGYGDSDDDEPADSEEEALSAAANAAVRSVSSQLGSRWVENKFLEFSPAPMPSSPSPKPGSPSESAPASKVKPPSPPRLEGKSGRGAKEVNYFRIAMIDAPLVQQVFASNGLTQTQDNNFSIQWSGPGLRESAYRELKENQRVNHFPGSTEMTRKDKMWLHLDRMKQTIGNGAFDFVPETFVLPDNSAEFRQRFKTTSDLWIVKPQNSSCGKGIFLLRSLKQLPANEPCVVSRYVSNPLLIQSLKFDLRIYVLVTSYDPLRAYIYREGLTRFASKPYSTSKKHLRDAFRHLTNYSVNKSAANFRENAELEADNYGHKWSLSALNKHLKVTGVDVDLMWSRIMDLVVKTLLAVEPAISAKVRETGVHQNNCFEMYGFDVLVDENLKPWLLEVNLSPSMRADSPLDWHVKSTLLSDAFNIVGVPDKNLLRQPITRRRSSALLRSGAFDVEEQSQSQPPASLFESLGEHELKSLACAFQEVKRCHNFIRLYPTRSTVKNYAPIVELQAPLVPRLRYSRLVSNPMWTSLSQLVALILFGPAKRARRGSLQRPLGVGSGVNKTEELSGYIEASLSQQGKTQTLPEPLAEGLALLRGDGEAIDRDSCRLLLAEYLIRTCNACSALQAADRAQLLQSAPVDQLLVFKQRLMDRVGKAQRLPSCSAKPGMPQPSKSVDLFDELMVACRTLLAQLVRRASGSRSGITPLTAQSASEEVSDKMAADNSVVALTDLFRPSTGSNVARAVASLSASDLERALQSPGCAPDFKPLLEPFPVSERKNGSSGSGREGLQQEGQPQNQQECALTARLGTCSLVPCCPLSELMRLGSPNPSPSVVGRADRHVPERKLLSRQAQERRPLTAGKTNPVHLHFPEVLGVSSLISPTKMQHTKSAPTLPTPARVAGRTWDLQPLPAQHPPPFIQNLGSIEIEL